MERVITTTKDDIEERERLMKVKLIQERKQSANRIMAGHLKDKNSIPEITDAVYAIARALGIKLEIKRQEKENERK